MRPLLHPTSVVATTSAVVTVLTLLAVYDLLVLGDQGASARDQITTYLFVAATAGVAGGTADAIRRLGDGAGLSVIAVVVGTASGGGFAALLAMLTGNGRDEGDGFFWLMVASLVVSVAAAVVAVAVGAVLARRADRPRG